MAHRIVKRTELSSNVAMAYLAILQKQGKLPQAIEWLDSVLVANPKQFGLRLIYARLLAEVQRYVDYALAHAGNESGVNLGWLGDRKSVV